MGLRTSFGLRPLIVAGITLLLLAAGCSSTPDTTTSTSAGAPSTTRRRALGYEQANFYGTSYGTRLGLDLIRDFPNGVRSIILDSVYPPHVDYYAESGPNLQRAFEYLFAACAADIGCSAAYPELETMFYDTVARLDANPEWADSPGGRVLMDGGIFMDAVSLYLYGGIGQAPNAIARAAAGDYGPLAGPITGPVSTSRCARNGRWMPRIRSRASR